MELINHYLFGSNLQSYWRLEGNSNDSKAGNNGTDSNITYGIANGKFGQGASFNGTSSDIALGNVFAFERTDAFSVVFWFNRGTGSSERHVFNKTKDVSAYTGWAVLFSGDKLNLVLINNNTNNLINVMSNATYADSVWHQAVVTYSGSSAASGVIMYIDGAAIASTILTDNLSASIVTTTNLHIGSRLNGALFYNGNLDDLAIWSRVLIAAEIDDLYKEKLEDYANFC